MPWPLTDLHVPNSPLLSRQIIIRVINTAKSAFLAATFGATFFDVYELLDEPEIRSAVLTKTILATFRTQRVSVITWDLEASQEVSRLSVTITADNGRWGGR